MPRKPSRKNLNVPQEVFACYLHNDVIHGGTILLADDTLEGLIEKIEDEQGPLTARDEIEIGAFTLAGTSLVKKEVVIRQVPKVKAKK